MKWLAGLLLCTGALLSGQTLQDRINSSAQIKNLGVYILFKEVGYSEAEAASLEAQGKPSAHLRGYYKTQMELTDAEDAALKQIAAECNQVVQDCRAQLTSKYADRPANQPIDDAEILQLLAIKERRINGINASIDRFENAIGTARFHQVGQWAEQVYSPTITQVPLVTFTQPATSIKAK